MALDRDNHMLVQQYGVVKNKNRTSLCSQDRIVTCSVGSTGWLRAFIGSSYGRVSQCNRCIGSNHNWQKRVQANWTTQGRLWRVWNFGSKTARNGSGYSEQSSSAGDPWLIYVLAPRDECIIILFIVASQFGCHGILRSTKVWLNISQTSIETTYEQKITLTVPLVEARGKWCNPEVCNKQWSN